MEKGVFSMNKNESMKLKVQILPEFLVVQHKRDIDILHQLQKHFDCGSVRVNHGDRMCYRVRGQANLRYKIVPFFEKYILKTKKGLDFLMFRDRILLLTPYRVIEL